MENEIWKPIEGYEDYYEVSNRGRVKAKQRIVCRGNIRQPVRERILKAGGGALSYPTVQLFKNGKGKRCTVHRLVAEAFIPNPDNLREVDHINSIRNDNHIENLRWVSHQDNMRNPTTMQLMRERVYDNEESLNKRLSTRIRNGGKKAQKRIFQYDTKGTFIKEWESGTAVEKEMGFNRKTIVHCARNKKYGYGYLWSFQYEKMKKYAPYSVQNKRIIQLNMDDCFIKEWESIKTAEKSLGIHSITRVLHGKKISAGGYKWKFATTTGAHLNLFPKI